MLLGQAGGFGDAAHHRLDIGAPDGCPGFGWGVQGRLVMRSGGASVVHQHIHAAKALRSFGEQALHVGLKVKIGNHGQRITTDAGDAFDQGLQGLARSRCDDHSGTGPGIGQRQGFTDAAGRAGHQHHRTLERGGRLHGRRRWGRWCGGWKQAAADLLAQQPAAHQQSTQALHGSQPVGLCSMRCA